MDLFFFSSKMPLGHRAGGLFMRMRKICIILVKAYNGTERLLFTIAGYVWRWELFNMAGGAFY